MKISVNAYAKINLFLDIESLRADGYHNIISHMQSVTLHDTLSVEREESDEKKISVVCDNSELPCDKSNLVYKAADIFPCNIGKVKIEIIKRIPMSAGLAGGSADAAATLIALNTLLGNPLSQEELKALGARLGADVPFCIEKGACIARGVGEVLEKTTPMPNYPIVIVRMGEGMSTPLAYKALDKKYNNFENYKPETDKLSIIVDCADAPIEEYTKGLFNIFESVVEEERPCVKELKSLLINNGAAASMMSGSGTSVFGIFKNEDDAKRAVSAASEKGAFAAICYPYKEEK
jgi:4-diphosphocytidyl-2-C-methyl-D-erythritol kinase